MYPLGIHGISLLYSLQTGLRSKVTTILWYLVLQAQILFTFQICFMHMYILPCQNFRGTLCSITCQERLNVCEKLVLCVCVCVMTVSTCALTDRCSVCHVTHTISSWHYIFGILRTWAQCPFHEHCPRYLYLFFKLNWKVELPAEKRQKTNESGAWATGNLRKRHRDWVHACAADW